MMNIKIRLIFFSTFFLMNVIAFGGFPAGTLVRSGNTNMLIEELRIGDLVTCYDFEAGCVEKPIVAAKTHKVKDLVCFVVNDKKIVTTKKQRFYLPDQKKWKKAVDLSVGDRLWGTCPENEPLVVQQVVRSKDLVVKDAITLYDISVKDCHNFLILENGILVHNWVPFLPACVIFFNFVFDNLFAFTSYKLAQASFALGIGAAYAAFNYFRSDSNDNKSKFNDFRPPQGEGPLGNSNNNNNDDESSSKGAVAVVAANKVKEEIEKTSKWTFSVRGQSKTEISTPKSPVADPKVCSQPACSKPACSQPAVLPYPENVDNRFAPLGRGSTGRRVPANLNEQVAMREIMSNPALGDPIKVRMTDKRWLRSDGWKKMAWCKRDFDEKGSKIEIHYVGQWIDGVFVAVDDFKFK